jgi:hypothetical protein
MQTDTRTYGCQCARTVCQTAPPTAATTILDSSTRQSCISKPQQHQLTEEGICAVADSLVDLSQLAGAHAVNAAEQALLFACRHELDLINQDVLGHSPHQADANAAQDQGSSCRLRVQLHVQSKGEVSLRE